MSQANVAVSPAFAADRERNLKMLNAGNSF
jgi:hypothetical protein